MACDDMFFFFFNFMRFFLLNLFWIDTIKNAYIFSRFFGKNKSPPPPPPPYAQKHKKNTSG